jgi:hypothetical protein
MGIQQAFKSLKVSPAPVYRQYLLQTESPPAIDLQNTTEPFHKFTKLFSPVFLNRRAAARYRAAAPIIPSREKFSWNLSF